MQNTLEVAADPQVRANGYITSASTKEGTTFELVSTPVQFDEQPATTARAPEFNEHCAEILLEAGIDAQRMIEVIRHKTRFHFSYVALAIAANSNGGPYTHWRRVRKALLERNANETSQAARDILYFMQGEVAHMMLAHGSRIREGAPMPAPVVKIKRRANTKRS